MRRPLPLFALLCACFITLLGCSSTQAVTGPSSSSSSDDDNGDIKPYSEVITAEAQTDEGLFDTHQIDDKLYYEVPDSLIGDEMLLITRIARTADNLGYGGEKANTLVVRWDRQDDDILMRVVSYENTADPDDPIYTAVQNSNLEPIVMAFPIKAVNEDSGTVVIDVTKLFTTDVKPLGLQQYRREQLKVRSLDESRTYLTEVESFPENVEIENILTYEAEDPPSNSSTGAITLEMNHSMVLLPKEPMQGRLCDDRVGYFNVVQVNYSADEQKAAERCFITRWRLEPSDPEAFARGELVEPVKPIVYYIDPATPEKWRPYLKQGVDDWNQAFEMAGFKNAIMAKDPPSAEEDSTFDPDDVRYSVIRYFASDIQNAYGPHVHDPRSGEILESDIGWYHNVMNLLRNWYFVQTSAANPKARSRKFEDEVMGELIRFVSAHEVGHTLGLPHNWGSSYATPVDSLRSPSYTSTHGTAPSIMDYARFNYVAQPGDGVTSFMPRIGTYDEWSIKWGYMPVEGGPQEEAAVLDSLVRRHADDPRYFYGRQTFSQVDPRSQREDLTGDVVEANTLGIENLKRTLGNLVEWSYKPGSNYDELEELYQNIVGQWDLFVGHVARNVGGIYETPKTYDQSGPVYEPVSPERQRDAMQFMRQQVFNTPEWLVNADVLRRFEGAGALERVREAQVDALEMVLDPQRMARVLEAEALSNEADVYELGEMFADLRDAVWTELDTGAEISPYRRNLQRGYVERLGYLMEAKVEAPPEEFQEYITYTPVNVSQSDIHAYVRGELRVLRDEVETALIQTAGETSRLHLEDILARIDRILDPEA